MRRAGRSRLEKRRAPNGKAITCGLHPRLEEQRGRSRARRKAEGRREVPGRAARAGLSCSVEDADVPVVGIYLAWRGKTLMGPSWFTAASLWSRRNTANNIGDGPDAARILNDIIEHTNQGNERSRVLLIGHSFGARVLEHAIESNKVKLYDTVDSRITPRVDLVLYVNSANDSRLSMGRIRALRDAKLRVHHPDYKDGECDALPAAVRDDETRAARCRDYPLIVAITSSGDSATKQLLPIANTINGDTLIPALQERLDQLPALPASNFADPTPSAGTIKEVAAGHFGFLQSHVAREITCPALPPPQREQEKSVDARIEEAVQRAVAEALGKAEDPAVRLAREAAEAARRRTEFRARFDRAMHPVCAANDAHCRFVFRTLGDKPACYQVDQRQPVEGKPPFNDSAFWVMSVAPTVIKDHGDIWNVSFIEMLGQLMAPRGFFEAASPRMQLRDNRRSLKGVIDEPRSSYDVRSGTTAKKMIATMARLKKGVLNVELDYMRLAVPRCTRAISSSARSMKSALPNRPLIPRALIIGSNFGGRRHVPFVIAEKGVRDRVEGRSITGSSGRLSRLRRTLINLTSYLPGARRLFLQGRTAGRHAGGVDQVRAAASGRRFTKSATRSVYGTSRAARTTSSSKSSRPTSTKRSCPTSINTFLTARTWVPTISTRSCTIRRPPLVSMASQRSSRRRMDKRSASETG